MVQNQTNMQYHQQVCGKNVYTCISVTFAVDISATINFGRDSEHWAKNMEKKSRDSAK